MPHASSSPWPALETATLFTKRTWKAWDRLKEANGEITGAPREPGREKTAAARSDRR